MRDKSTNRGASGKQTYRQNIARQINKQTDREEPTKQTDSQRKKKVRNGHDLQNPRDRERTSSTFTQEKYRWQNAGGKYWIANH